MVQASSGAGMGLLGWGPKPQADDFTVVSCPALSCAVLSYSILSRLGNGGGGIEWLR